MEKSNSIQEIAKAIIQFHIKVETVKKDATNPFFKSKYASLSNILEAIQIPLEESGLSFSQFPTGENGLTTILMHTSGEYLQSDYNMQPVKNDPQGKGSVITYQRRYALAAVLGLNIDEDDDANEATHGGKTPEKAAENNKPWLNKNTKEFDGAVKKLREGTTTIAKIREVMKVSKEVETLLNNAVNELSHAN
jgi:hypothetical protein